MRVPNLVDNWSLTLHALCVHELIPWIESGLQTFCHNSTFIVLPYFLGYLFITGCRLQLAWVNTLLRLNLYVCLLVKLIIITLESSALLHHR